jgi:hypothetical protein
MAAIFISHSSKDEPVAAELQRLLQQQGHRSIFLDFDPANGIPAGRDWERELYTQLRACQALIVLCSEHTMGSKWCFAEITHARAMGKPIFPIKIANCELESLVASRQAIDVARDGPVAYERLWAGLQAIGIDPHASFDWDGSRPPYPGLMAFQEADAAVFFGREGEIQETLERLNRLRRFGGSRLLSILGPSGSGKSSLVRAGVLPRLRRDAESWIVVDAFRPRASPLRELAIVVAESMSRHGERRQWQAVYARLTGASRGAPRQDDALAAIGLDFVWSVDFSPDGRWLATASRDNSAVIWDYATGEPYLRLVHNGPAKGAGFSPDGTWLVTWDAWRGPARVWEVSTGTEVARVAHEGVAIAHAEFSPDGRSLLTAGEDGTARVWKWQAEDIVAELCSRVTRNLTPDEWRRFVGDEPYRETCPDIRPADE